MTVNVPGSGSVPIKTRTSGSDNEQVVAAEHVLTAVGDGTTTVTTAGTAVALGGNVPIQKVDIQAHESNTGTIVVGGSTVVAAISGRRGLGLKPLDTFCVEAANLNLIYLDSTASGDKVNYIYHV